MKIGITFALLFAIALLVIGPQIVIAQKRVREKSLATSGVQSESEQEADKFWGNYVASCRGAYYIRKAPGIFVELRGFRIETRGESRTEADRLNGLQAKGTSRFTASAHRFYSESAWRRWGDGLPQDMQLINSVRFQKAQGRWTFQGDGYFNDYAKKVACSDVPGLAVSTKKEVPTNSIQVDDTHNLPIEQFILWESNTNQVENRFSQSTTTFVNWKIVYSGTAFDYKPPRVESYWFKEGKQFAYVDGSNFSNNTGKGMLWNGRGWSEPGHWEVGLYSVKIYVGKKLVRIGQFEIAHDTAFSQELRFDGLYRSTPPNTSNGYAYLRFYSDGIVLSANQVPANARVDVCVSLVRHKYAMGCDRFSYRTGRYTKLGNAISWSWDPKERAVPVNVSGIIGHNMLKLDYELPTARVYHKDRVYTFVSVGRLY